ncbi:MAG: ABC transporter permease [Anaerolineae bacterium]|nr:ABC transporter permease [Anaerolineae bacterium]
MPPDSDVSTTRPEAVTRAGPLQRVWARVRGWNWEELAIPFLAVFTAVVVGALVIFGTRMYELGQEDVVLPLGEMVRQSLLYVGAAYLGLFEGAIGSQRAIFDSIGGEGQLYMGALLATIVGFSIKGLPIYVHLPMAVLAGALGGAIWGAIPGFLKAVTGAHEVINTIMMNYIAVKTVDYLVKNVIRDPTASLDRTPFVEPSARYPLLTPEYSLHAGFLVALAATVFVWWFLYKTTLGFEVRTVGLNPSAARYAGMSVAKNFVLAMALAGALAGLGGVGIVLGRPSEYSLKAAFSTGFGFDSIAVALLAKSHPIGNIPAAFLWGALRNGAGLMQVRAPGISIDLVNIVQALVIVFVAADEIVRWLYRIRARRAMEVVFTRGWGR